MGLVSSVFYVDKAGHSFFRIFALSSGRYSSCFFRIQEFNLRRLRLVEDFLFATIFGV